MSYMHEYRNAPEHHDRGPLNWIERPHPEKIFVVKLSDSVLAVAERFLNCLVVKPTSMKTAAKITGANGAGT